MREIKFRGYSKEDNQWHYGSLMHIVKGYFVMPIEDGDLYPVEEESIGQYTGFKCINGTKIYEGDILSGIINPVHRYIIMWSRGHWVAKDTYDLGELFLSSLHSDVQVVGNAYIDKLKEKERI